MKYTILALSLLLLAVPMSASAGANWDDAMQELKWANSLAGQNDETNAALTAVVHTYGVRCERYAQSIDSFKFVLELVPNVSNHPAFLEMKKASGQYTCGVLKQFLSQFVPADTNESVYGMIW